MRLITIVHEIRAASGTNAKIKILKKYKDNNLWQLFLKYTYDTSKAYYVSDPKTPDFDIEDITSDMFSVFDKLSNRVISGNKAKQAVKNLSKEFGEIPRLILNRSIKAGISTTTINKVYPKLIPVFESMKGVDCEILSYPVLSSVKFDGVKVFVEVSNTSTILRTSSGTEFILKSLIKEFESASHGVYEGELIHKEGKQIHRPVISGQLNSLMAGTIDDISDYNFCVYDWIDLTCWDIQKCSETFETRQEFLKAAFFMGIQDSKYIKKVKHIEHNTLEEVVEYFESLVKEGYEGSMHRYADGVYTWKRSDALIKKKSIKEAILTCVDTTLHSNPLKGLVGSLVCQGTVPLTKTKSVLVKVNIGSGLSKYDIMQDPETYIGKNIEVLYNTVTETDKGYSLFLPRFKRICKTTQ